MKIGNLNLNNNKYVKKQEGSVEFYLYKKDNDSIPSKSMGVFYNERMEINRDISILAILTYNKLINRDSLVMVDCMAASGIGSIRLLKASNNFKKIFINDINPIAVELIKRNLKLNDLEKNTQIFSSHKDANLLCIEIFALLLYVRAKILMK
ncbi:tRNA (guanine(26)-N(2))-dimethyltransferase [subsurface metagenome]